MAEAPLSAGCQQLGVSYIRAWRAVLVGELPAVRSGRHLLVALDNLAAFKAADTARQAKRAHRAKLRAELAELSR